MLDLANLVTLQGLEAAYTGPDGRPVYRASTVRGWIQRNDHGFRDLCVISAGNQRYVDLVAFAKWLELRRGSRPRRRQMSEAVDEPATHRTRLKYSFEELLAGAGLSEISQRGNRPRRQRRERSGAHTASP